MRNEECVLFLQWALPQLNLRWKGFRRVRQQVCKRIQRRLKELELPDFNAYRFYLKTHPEEWLVLDSYCQITISRFYRDRAVFNYLGQVILPELAQLARFRGERQLRVWSAGCASGEEVYSLKILWNLSVLPQFPGLALQIIATDVNAQMLKRASRGCYQLGSLKELPPQWLEIALTPIDGLYCIRDSFREGIDFVQQDIRWQMPDGCFHLILCRNLVFTYFQKSLQQKILSQIEQKLILGGILVIGSHESLPLSQN